MSKELRPFVALILGVMASIGLMIQMAPPTDAANGWRSPVGKTAKVGTLFGGKGHPYTGKKKHFGVDYLTRHGAAVYAARGGYMVPTNTRWCGRGYYIGHGKVAGRLTLTTYCHLATRKFNKPVRVKAGQRIGSVGKSGAAKRVHLHFEMHHRSGPVNPFRWGVPRPR